MPIDPIKIPQNVYIEDRIVGPLTLKQVLICALGGGFSYAMFASISKTYGSIALPLQLLVWLPAALSAIFAFVRINDLSMMRLCLLTLERMNKSPTRVWTPRRGIIINVRTFHTAPESKESKMSQYIDKKTEKIDKISTALDRGPMEETAPELGQMADEPLADIALEEDMNPNLIRTTPVNPARITASPATDNPVDTLVPKAGSVSIFRDISPASHV